MAKTRENDRDLHYFTLRASPVGKASPEIRGITRERRRMVSQSSWWSIFMETQGSRTVNRGAKNGSPPPGRLMEGE